MPDFWEQPEQVRRFADRPPDQRMVDLLEDVPETGAMRILDLGCAGGRNTVWLAERGFDVVAIDASKAMIRETRRRVRPYLGQADATRRVRIGQMDDPAIASDRLFDVVLAIGILHNARSSEEWQRTIGTLAAALKTAGLLLVSTFAVGSRLDGSALHASPSDPHVYKGAKAGPLYLVTQNELDEMLKDHGLLPARPTETVRRETESGIRVTCSGLYRKAPDDERRAD